MGEKKVAKEADESHRRAFTKAVLNDLNALEKMLKKGLLEEHELRIGAEQEMFLTDSAMRPAPLAIEVIEEAQEPRLTTEIGRFNLEANLTPLGFSGNCLSLLEAEIEEVIGKVKRIMQEKFRGNVVLCGILPTIQQSDLVHKNLTPSPRYEELNRVLTELHGEQRIVHIKGLDEVNLYLKNTFTEFCNTSFQVHLQVGIKDFVNSYNWAQAVSAPVLASAVNSSLLFGQRLWHETRLALFQHATDERSPVHQARNNPPRVNFGEKWVKDSILEIFHEDVARFRIILTRDLEENSLQTLEKGEIPKLSAWRMHNGTVWRWNRACYGVIENRPSLRIEARFLPSGPTIVDEVANAAFFLGLMMALPPEFGEVSKIMAFDDAKDNFYNVARNGLKTQLNWLDGKAYRASRLILEELLPRAKQGLRSVNIDTSDIEKYLGIIEERVRQEKTGSQWMIDSLAQMDTKAKANVRLRSLTESLLKQQEEKKPLHFWELASIPETTDWIDNYRTVEQFMSRDLFTVRPEDVVDLAASLMNWKHIRHVPVENDKGEIVGIISHRDLLQIIVDDKTNSEIVVKNIMQKNLVTVSPETSTLEALSLMRQKNIGCLPVIKNGKLVGLLTAHDFLTVSTKLFEERLRNLA